MFDDIRYELHNIDLSIELHLDVNGIYKHIDGLLLNENDIQFAEVLQRFYKENIDVG